MCTRLYFLESLGTRLIAALSPAQRDVGAMPQHTTRGIYAHATPEGHFWTVTRYSATRARVIRALTHHKGHRRRSSNPFSDSTSDSSSYSDYHSRSRHKHHHQRRKSNNLLVPQSHVKVIEFTNCYPNTSHPL